MKYQVEGQLKMFDDEVKSKDEQVKSNAKQVKKLKTFHLFAVDKFGRKMDAFIDAECYGRAVYKFKATFGFYWRVHN